MADHYLHLAVGLPCTVDEADLITECFEVSNDLSAGMEPSYDERSEAFRATFPSLEAFLDLFDDPDYPEFNATCDATGDGVYIAGDQADPGAIAAVIQKTLKSALPCSIEWAFTCSKLRVGEFGGGFFVITEDGIEGGSTTWLAMQVLDALSN